MTIAISRDHEISELSDQHTMLVMHATRSFVLKRQYRFFGEAQISLCAKHPQPEPIQPYLTLETRCS